MPPGCGILWVVFLGGGYNFMANDRRPDDMKRIATREQAEAFFQGQKTAEAVAKLTQSKANIYVNEQR